MLTEKIYCCQGLIQYGFEDEVCSFHECLETPIDHSFYAEEVDDYLWHHANEAIVEEKNESFYPKKFTAFNKTFFEVGIKVKSFIYKWIYILALPDEAKNFYFHACVKNENGDDVLTYYDQVHSLVESPMEVMQNENCFIFGVKKAKKFMKTGTTLVDYSLKIRSLKDEAKDEDEESGIDD